ncbi:RNA-directed DNA polymerase from mobile element jockey [Trichonephila clavata]|uniref:RNA-directed DNA polymerase from mobile element jockey n=1 Tax=Trichonephila clavata TaxID=2740835 RepID=A0A8X6L4S9_TRICU|nr:RNA-directed DNA polymerase from mobile element jockey [Trichonephila clavata]
MKMNDKYNQILQELHRTHPTATNSYYNVYIKIRAETPDHHREITTYLTAQKVEYFVNDPVANRPLKLVIKGLPASTKVEDIKSDLIAKGINVDKVSQLKKFSDKSPLPINMIEVVRDENVDDIFARSLGGTALCIKRNIPHYHIPPTTVEATLVALTPNDHEPILVASIYFPPGSSASLGADLDTIFNINKSAILMGDFNVKHTSWGCSRRETRGNRLYNYILRNNIDLFAPNTPTRYGTASATIIDYALVKNINWPCTIDSLSELSSDHNPIKLFFPRTSKFNLPNPQLNTTWSTFTNILSNVENFNLPDACSSHEIDSHMSSI